MNIYSQSLEIQKSGSKVKFILETQYNPYIGTKALVKRRVEWVLIIFEGISPDVVLENPPLEFLNYTISKFYPMEGLDCVMGDQEFDGKYQSVGSMKKDAAIPILWEGEIVPMKIEKIIEASYGLFGLGDKKKAL